MNEQVCTIQNSLKKAKQILEKNSIENARLDAEILLAHALGQKRIYLYINNEKILSEDELKNFFSFVTRRAQGEPVAYILGQREFMGLEFTVSPDVLVPQPDTEILVGAVMDRLPKTSGEKILDIGTGSGAIALSLLHDLPELQACAVDISPKALKIAQVNAKKFNLEKRIEFLEGNLFEPLQNFSEKFFKKFSAIVSNPPYIKTDEIAQLPREVQAEPKLALDGGADGLYFYRKIIFQASQFLQPNGFLAVEAGLADEIILLSRECSDWDHQKTEILKDLAGKDRVIIFWKREQ